VFGGRDIAADRAAGRSGCNETGHQDVARSDREVDGGADRVTRGEMDSEMDSEMEYTKVGGARAIGLGLAVGRNAVWPTAAWKVPGASWVFDRIYDLIATNRHRLPGETPWCEKHPGQCAVSAP
jgi:hypothetical protein